MKDPEELQYESVDDIVDSIQTTMYCPVCCENVPVNSRGVTPCGYVDCPNDSEDDYSAYQPLSFD